MQPDVLRSKVHVNSNICNADFQLAVVTLVHFRKPITRVDHVDKMDLDGADVVHVEQVNAFMKR